MISTQLFKANLGLLNMLHRGICRTPGLAFPLKDRKRTAFENSTTVVLEEMEIYFPINTNILRRQVFDSPHRFADENENLSLQRLLSFLLYEPFRGLPKKATIFRILRTFKHKCQVYGVYHGVYEGGVYP